MVVQAVQPEITPVVREVQVPSGRLQRLAAAAVLVVTVMELRAVQAAAPVAAQAVLAISLALRVVVTEIRVVMAAAAHQLVLLLEEAAAQAVQVKIAQVPQEKRGVMAVLVTCLALAVLQRIMPAAAAAAQHKLIVL